MKATTDLAEDADGSRGRRATNRAFAGDMEARRISPRTPTVPRGAESDESGLSLRT
jgi:hypothetical protein